MVGPEDLGRAATIVSDTPSPPSASRATTFRAEELVAGRYRIRRFIARGGMGEVYEADDFVLGERVALKTVLPEVAGDDQVLARFRREIQIARQVTHPNACRVYDVGFEPRPGGDVTFLTMELLEGETLHARLLRDGAMTPRAARPLVEQMALGLAAAHALGVVHRDFKSHNVILVGERAVVTDFGLARRQEGAQGSLSIDGAGHLVGTPAYMAPEQVRGDRVTPATDVYALGVVLFEMLTGRLPFSGDTPLAMAVRRLEGPAPSLRSCAPHLDAAWEALVARCLALRPEERFRDGAEVAASLPNGRPTHLRWPLVASASALALAGLLLGQGQVTPAPAPLPVRGEQLGAAQLLEEGRARMLHGELAAARVLLEKAVAADDRLALGHAYLAMAWGGLAEEQRASVAAKRAYDLSFERPPVERLQIEQIYYRSIGDPRHLALARTFWALHPGEPAASFALATEGTIDSLLGIAALRAHPAASELPGIDLVEASLSMQPLPGGSLERGVSLARRVEDRARAAGNQELLARAYVTEALLLTAQGNATEAAQRAARARELAEQLGLRGLLLQALTQEGIAQLGQGRLTEAAATFERSTAMAHEMGSVREELWGTFQLSACYKSLGQLAEARARMEAYTAAMAQMKVLPWMAHGTARLADLYLLEGDVHAARRKADEAAAIAEIAGGFGDQGDARGSVLFAEDRLDEATVAIERALQAVERQGSNASRSLAGLASLALARDRAVDAERYARLALARTATLRGTYGDEECVARLLLASALLAQGQAKTMEAIVELAQAEPRIARTEDLEIRVAGVIVAARVRVAADDPQAPAAWQRLRELRGKLESMGCVALALEVRLALGELEVTKGRRAEGRKLLGEVEREARSRGFLLVARQARAHLR